MKTKVTLEVIGHNQEISEFLRLCRFIQSFGTYGMSRKIDVVIDGDGSGKLSMFYVLGNETKELPLFELKDLREIDEKKIGYNVDIGE